MANNKPPDQKKSKGPLLTLTVGLIVLVAAAGGLYTLMGQNSEGSDDRASAANDGTAQVVVATADIEVGTLGQTIVDDALFEVTSVSLAELPANPIVDPSQLAGRILAVPKVGGEILALSDLTTTDGQAVTDVPDGMEAVAVTLDFDPAVAGYVRAGDRVTIYSILAPATTPTVIGVDGQQVTPEATNGPVVQTLLTNVQILDVSNDVAPRYVSQSDARPTVSSITYLLAVKPEDAARVIYASTNERLHFALVRRDNPTSDQVRIDQNDIRADPRIGDLAAVTPSTPDEPAADPAATPSEDPAGGTDDTSPPPEDEGS